MNTAKRLFIIGLAAALVVSYIGPIRGYRAQQAELRAQETALKALVQERDAKRLQLGRVPGPAVIEARARQLGYVKPGEVQYRITGLDEVRPPDPPERREPGFWSRLPAIF